jgi:hypothetical protein
MRIRGPQCSGLCSPAARSAFRANAAHDGSEQPNAAHAQLQAQLEQLVASMHTCWTVVPGLTSGCCPCGRLGQGPPSPLGAGLAWLKPSEGCGCRSPATFRQPVPWAVWYCILVCCAGCITCCSVHPARRWKHCSMCAIAQCVLAGGPIAGAGWRPRVPARIPGLRPEAAHSGIMATPGHACWSGATERRNRKSIAASPRGGSARPPCEPAALGDIYVCSIPPLHPRMRWGRGSRSAIIIVTAAAKHGPSWKSEMVFGSAALAVRPLAVRQAGQWFAALRGAASARRCHTSQPACWNAREQ